MPNLPVPNPASWTPGENVTSALLDTQVRDALNFLLNPPMYVGKQTTAQTIQPHTYTAITLDATVVDTYSGLGQGGYVAQVAGWYLCTGVICYNDPANSTGFRNVFVTVNGVNMPAASGAIIAAEPVSGGGTATTMTAFAYLNVGDLVNLVGAHANSTAIDTTVGNYQKGTFPGDYSSLQVMWVHI